MYAGVVFYMFDPDNIDEAMDRWKESVLGQAKHQKGFREATMFLNRKTGNAFDVGFWDSEEDASRFEESGTYGLVMEEMKDMLKATPKREMFEVVHRKTVDK